MKKLNRYISFIISLVAILLLAGFDIVYGQPGGGGPPPPPPVPLGEGFIILILSALGLGVYEKSKKKN